MEKYQHSYYYDAETKIIKHHVIDCHGRIVDAHNEQTWKAAGNEPEIISGDRFISIVKGVPVLDPRREEILLAEAKTAKYSEVKALRAAKIAEGCVYKFPDAPGTIQSRNADDIGNVMGLTIKAIIRKEEDLHQRLKDAENVEHILDPTEMIAAGESLACRKTAIMSASWAKEKEINSQKTIEAVEAYDIYSGWPE